jgi:hypothetical protein
LARRFGNVTPRGQAKILDLYRESRPDIGLRAPGHDDDGPDERRSDPGNRKLHVCGLGPIIEKLLEKIAACATRRPPIFAPTSSGTRAMSGPRPHHQPGSPLADRASSVRQTERRWRLYAINLITGRDVWPPVEVRAAIDGRERLHLTLTQSLRSLWPA